MLFIILFKNLLAVEILTMTFISFIPSSLNFKDIAASYNFVEQKICFAVEILTMTFISLKIVNTPRIFAKTFKY